MSSLDNQQNHFLAIEPSKYATLDKLVIAQDSPPGDLTSYISVEIELLGKQFEDGMLHIKFFGVQQLQIKMEKSYHAYSILSIISIKERQWDQLDYAVREREENIFSFFCAYFEFEIKPIPPIQED
jgi:hypothetical protein